MDQNCNQIDRTAADSPSASVIRLFSEPAKLGAQAVRQLNLAMIGTYVPRKCGIATFTADMVEQLGTYQSDIATTVYALDHVERFGDYAAGVIPVDHASRDAYLECARKINESGADAVWLQHEYGIFGGPDGELVCDLVDCLAAPLVVTFHTVLSEPSANQRRITEHLLSRASRDGHVPAWA